MCRRRPHRIGVRTLDLLASKARWAWLAARLVVDRYPESAASRAYYAVHHALRWRLAGDLPRGHGGMGDAHVLGQAGLDPGDARTTSTLYALRHRADYSGTHRVTADEGRYAVGAAEDLLRRLGIDPEVS